MISETKYKSCVLRSFDIFERHRTLIRSVHFARMALTYAPPDGHRRTLTESEVFKDEILSGTESTHGPSEEIAERRDDGQNHGRNLIEARRIKSCAAQKPMCGPANYRNGWLLTQLTVSARNRDDWHSDSLVSPVKSRCDAEVKTQHFSSCFLSRL